MAAKAAASKTTQAKRAVPREKVKQAGKAAGRRTVSKLAGFVEFIRERGVIGLAVGLAIGTAASGLVAQIVGALVTPTIVLLIGADGLKSLNTEVEIAGRSATYAFGDLMDALLKFVAIAAVIYFVVHGLKLDKFDKKKEG